MKEILLRNNIRRRILVVDDEMINRMMLGNIVGREFDVIYAENGVQALEALRAENTISLVLLDLHMPEMDGYELLEIMRADEELRKIPVIVLTSEKSAEVESLRLGAVDFIPKPYDFPEVIMARINRSVELAEDKMMINETGIDSLTSLLTKAFFFQYVLRNDSYHPDADMDVIIININRFHLINAIYGMSYGDEVLKAIGSVISETVKGTGGLACRCDADTFYVYLPHCDDYEALFKEKCDRITDLVGNTHITLRAGIYEHADKSLSIDQRFDRANLVCSKLRSSYKSAYAIYDDEIHQKELYAERLVLDMDKALEEKQFIVCYQPKYNIRGDRPVLSSAEALIRWNHPEYGFISPGLFIPLFEENGLVHQLDRYVWNEAAAQIKRWKDEYNKTIPVSVNVSRIDIYDPGFEDEIKGIVRSNGLMPSEYLLEITESAYTDDSQKIIETVERLRAEGFHIEMDDFGSGYSSLNMLADLPIDVIKLDMKFIHNICTREKDCQMVKLMIEIADFMKVPIIAEGVETEEQYLLLKEMGCDIIQGYYFSKPLQPADFAELIEKELRSE